MDEKVNELYNLWMNLKNEEEKYLVGWLHWNVPLFTPTIEGLSAYKAYRSLPNSRRGEYALYSSHLYDIFFLLDEEKIGLIERTLPPYAYIGEMIWKEKSLPEEEVEILKRKLPRNPLKARELLKKKEKILRKYDLISEEYEDILERRKEDDWKDLRKIMAFFYGITSVEIYLSTSDFLNPLLYLSTFPIPYQILKYFSFKFSNKKLKNYIDKLLLLYFFAKSPIGLVISTVKFGILASFIPKIIEKYWHSRYFPNFLRKSLYSTEIFLSNLKPKRFDEREIREELYNIRIDSQNIPKSAVDRFKEEVDNEIIEIEDPRKLLLDPWAISWYRRRVVAIPEGKEIKVVDKNFVAKLARKEGVFLDEMEERIKKRPLTYLGFDLWNGKIVFTRDIIGILPCKIQDALAYKEGYTAVLGKKADKILEERWNFNYKKD